MLLDHLLSPSLMEKLQIDFRLPPSNMATIQYNNYDTLLYHKHSLIFTLVSRVRVGVVLKWIYKMHYEDFAVEQMLHRVECTAFSKLQTSHVQLLLLRSLGSGTESSPGASGGLVTARSWPQAPQILVLP